ncbi:serine hydrolase domain-containing protein [Idiomarina xiamenensis]|uniref:Beta-lactamase n=1 Tax=Idiomarina xiamenensis 10-D-4 TaxID=740709 RepID=K2J9L5_9GAMM|nr:serine hydrolase domain-containing protein [Idiomarina xiamenensis]EKE79956.1 beta-lactamase [Idiomarina xiamenensis 10-D-4]
MQIADFTVSTLPARACRAVLMGLMLLTPAVSANAQQDVSFEDIESYIDGTVEAQRAVLEIPAVTVSVVHQGQLIFSKGYGIADNDADKPVNAETSLFRIGSISKLFTWTAVMQLHEQGKLDLDADVNQYLDFRIPDTFEQPITLRHILTHTAGFEDGALGYLIQYYPNKGIALEQAMQKYMPARLNPPGKVSSYSNYATALAGLIVQRVSGEPFSEYVQRHIFEPLAMHNSSFEEPLPETIRANMVKGYIREQGVLSEQPFEMIDSFSPAGAMSSSANDMARFMLAHLNNGVLDGQRILQADTAQLMHSPLFHGDERLSGMAYGFYEEHINGHRLIGHGGDTMQFHSNLLLDEEQQLGIFVSYMTTTDSQARGAFIEQFYDHYFPYQDEKLTAPADFAERAGQYAGSYIFWRRNDSTIEKAMGLLSGGVSVTPTADNTLLVDGPFDARQYVEIDDNLFRQVDGDELIAFVPDEQGQMTTMYYDSLPFMSLQRTPLLATTPFKVLLPLLSLLLFVHVLISWCYKRKHYKTLSGSQRWLRRSAQLTSLANVTFVVLTSVILISYGEALFTGFPWLFKANLIFPIIASLLALLTLVLLVKSLVAGELSWGRKIYYGLVTLAGLYMLLFYYYWNILGWNYIA